MKKVKPPRLAIRFFRWYCHPMLLKYIEGDLMELYGERVKELGKRKADRKFIIDVLLSPRLTGPSKKISFNNQLLNVNG